MFLPLTIICVQIVSAFLLSYLPPFRFKSTQVLGTTTLTQTDPATSPALDTPTETPPVTEAPITETPTLVPPTETIPSPTETPAVPTAATPQPTETAIPTSSEITTTPGATTTPTSETTPTTPEVSPTLQPTTPETEAVLAPEEAILSPDNINQETIDQADKEDRAIDQTVLPEEKVSLVLSNAPQKIDAISTLISTNDHADVTYLTQRLTGHLELVNDSLNSLPPAIQKTVKAQAKAFCTTAEPKLRTQQLIVSEDVGQDFEIIRAQCANLNP